MSKQESNTVTSATTTTTTTTTVRVIDNDDTNQAAASFSSDPQAPIFSVTGVPRGSYIPSKMSMLRSPSRESVGTDISLFSVSTLASELTSRVKLLSVKMPGDSLAVSRGPSPNFDRRKRPENIQEVWFEEANDMIRGMVALSSAVGLSKSFSTSDITNLPPSLMEEDIGIMTAAGAEGGVTLSKRNATSELTINSCHHSGFLFDQSVKLDNASRSCSTWVAVGDIPSTSQLPSPHGGGVPSAALLTSNSASCSPAFTPADLIRSVNKKVRQHYIKRRLMNTYKALERLSQSEFNLDKLELEAAASVKTGGGSGAESRTSSATGGGGGCGGGDSSTGKASNASNRLSVPGASSNVSRQWKKTTILDPAEERLTVTDVERERGQPLSKYDRNMMIFNWLLTLEPDENVVDSLQ